MWEDGTPYSVHLSNWRKGEPGPGELCVRINRLEETSLFGLHCTHPSIMGSCLCEKNLTTTIVTENGCTFGYNTHMDKCYLMPPDLMSYPHCVQACLEQGGRITSIANKQENTVLGNL